MAVKHISIWFLFSIVISGSLFCVNGAPTEESTTISSTDTVKEVTKPAEKLVKQERMILDSSKGDKAFQEEAAEEGAEEGNEEKPEGEEDTGADSEENEPSGGEDTDTKQDVPKQEGDAAPAADGAEMLKINLNKIAQRSVLLLFSLWLYNGLSLF